MAELNLPPIADSLNGAQPRALTNFTAQYLDQCCNAEPEWADQGHWKAGTIDAIETVMPKRALRRRELQGKQGPRFFVGRRSLFLIR